MKNNEKKIFYTSIIISFILVALTYLFKNITMDVSLLPDKGASWYYWKLPIRNNLTMIIVWLLFGLHLIGNYVLIRKRIKIKKYGFNKINLYLLIYNLFFILLHQFQTIISFDGLAQDVSVFSSQYSVILVLVIILLMKLNSRGFIFGYKLNLQQKSLNLLYKIHGFVFVFSIIYTFWYHPMVFTLGHSFGFLYIFLFLIQVSFIKTQIHTKKYWTIVLEFLVALHSTSVAFFVQNSEIWRMFLFGFLFIFISNQIYDFNFKKKNIILIQLIYFISAFITYYFYDIYKIHQILWIPLIEYLHLIILYILFSIFNKLKLIK